MSSLAFETTVNTGAAQKQPPDEKIMLPVTSFSYHYAVAGFNKVSLVPEPK